jgi:hypothetical protein
MARQSVVVSATIVDSWGTEAAAAAYALADDTKTLAQVIADADLYFVALDAVTDGFIRRVKLTIEPPVPGGVKTAALGTGAKVEQTGVLNFSATGTSKRYGLAIPAVADSTLVADRMTLGAGAMATFIALLVAVGTAIEWANDHSQQIVAFVDALVSFRKKRKQLQRSSFEAAP